MPFRASEIAYHWLESLPLGDPARACQWAERAADQALGQLAWERAASCTGGHGRPVPAHRRRPDPPADRQGSRTARRRRRGPRVPALTAAAEAAREIERPRRARRCDARDGGPVRPGDRRGGLLAGEALAGAPGDTRCAPAARLQAGEAVVAGGVDSDRVSAEAWPWPGGSTTGRCCARPALTADGPPGPDGVTERLGLGNRMLALGKADDDDDTMLWGRLWRFDALAMLGPPRRGRGQAGAMLALTERLQRPLARGTTAQQDGDGPGPVRLDAATTAARKAWPWSRGGCTTPARRVGHCADCDRRADGRDELVSEQMLEVFAATHRGSPAPSCRPTGYGAVTGNARAATTPRSPQRLLAPALLSVAAAIVELTAEFGPSATRNTRRRHYGCTLTCSSPAARARSWSPVRFGPSSASPRPPPDAPTTRSAS